MQRTNDSTNERLNDELVDEETMKKNFSLPVFCTFNFAYRFGGGLCHKQILD